MTAVAPVPAVIIANLAARERWARFATLAIGAAAVILFGSRGVGELIASRSLYPGFILVLAATAAALVMSKRVRGGLARRLPLAPSSPVTMLALQGVILVVGDDLYYQAGHDVLATVSRLPQIQVIDVVMQSVGLAILALAGVGWLIHRSSGETLARLGIVRPAWWQITLALVAAGLFFAAAQAIEGLQEVLDPVQARRLTQATSHYYAGVTGIAGIAVIALAPGIAEEALFRGALQPRLGLALTAVAFAAVHSQYALTVDTLLVLTLGAALGAIRRYLNTTSAMITHSAYNALVGLRLADQFLVPAMALEVVLIVLTAVLYWRSAHRPAPAASS